MLPHFASSLLQDGGHEVESGSDGPVLVPFAKRVYAKPGMWHVFLNGFYVTLENKEKAIILQEFFCLYSGKTWHLT